MQTPLQIVFDDFAPSAAVEGCVRRKFETLEPLCDQISSAQIVVARPRYRFCGTYEVRIHLMTPDTSDDFAHHAAPIVAVDEDVYTAIDDAFEIMQRRSSSQTSSHESDELRKKFTGTQAVI